MKDLTNRDFIIAAFNLGHALGKQEEVARFLEAHRIPFTATIGKQLIDDHTLFTGYAPLYPITDLEVPDEILAKFLAGTPKILVMGELSLLTKEDLAERYKLTPEEVEEVRATYKLGGWELLDSAPSSD